MADEKEALKTAEPDAGAKGEAGEKDAGPAAAGKKGGKKSRLLLIVAPIALVALTAGGYFGYTFLSHGKGKGAAAKAADKKEGKAVLFPVEPFVVNLSEPGRYLKVTMQFETAGEMDDKSLTEKVPIMRDTIITLIGNQTYEYAASTEGKVQLKDEILLRTNRLFGKEVFRNLYFTDFVMQ